MNSTTCERPIISCVVATYNAANYLPTLLASFAEQDLKNTEIIVQDGASTDATMALLNQWQKRLPSLRISSRRDKGIYEAWNNALDRVTGEWVLFLGADDKFISPASLQSAESILYKLGPKTIYLATPVVIVSDASSIAVADSKSIQYPSIDIGHNIHQGMIFPHQGLFHRRTIFDKYRFNTRLHIAGDYDFLARTFSLGDIEVRDLPLVCMAVGGVSTSLSNMWRSELEQLCISRQHFSKSFPWKIYVRLTRSILCAVLAKLFGLTTAARFANFLRKLRRRPPLWNISSK